METPPKKYIIDEFKQQWQSTQMLQDANNVIYEYQHIMYEISFSVGDNHDIRYTYDKLFLYFRAS